MRGGVLSLNEYERKRRGVLNDANQNGSDRTIASMYSVRPQPGSAVSALLRWDEFTEDAGPLDFPVNVVLGRIEREGGPFVGAVGGKQSLMKALRRRQGD
jgi:DNA primase